ncbi:jg25545, partial [Pararge aegeria aegeria]
MQGHSTKLSLMYLELRRQQRPSDRNNAMVLGGRYKHSGNSPDQEVGKKQLQ